MTVTAKTTQQIKDLIGWMRKYNRAARAAQYFFLQFFDVVCQLSLPDDNVGVKQGRRQTDTSTLENNDLIGWCEEK